MSKDGSGTVLEPKMFRINQLEQEYGFLMQEHMACQITLQLWIEDHKRVTVDNQDLRRELNDRENQWMSRTEAAEGWMDQMEEKQKQQEEKLKTLEAELNINNEMIARMMEEMSIQKQEKEILAVQN